MTTPKPIDDLIRELREVVRPGRMIMVAGTSMDQLITALESERAKSKRYRNELKFAVTTLRNIEALEENTIELSISRMDEILEDSK